MLLIYKQNIPVAFNESRKSEFNKEGKRDYKAFVKKQSQTEFKRRVRERETRLEVAWDNDDIDDDGAMLLRVYLLTYHSSIITAGYSGAAVLMLW